jgi:hypothetical protein
MDKGDSATRVPRLAWLWLPCAVVVLLSCGLSAAGRHEGTIQATPEIIHRTVHQNRYYATVGKSNEVYEWRVHACDVLSQLGLHPGHVFRGAGGAEPDAVWQIELDPEVAKREGLLAQKSPEFQEVMKHMGTLIRRFEHSTFREERLIIDDKSIPAPSQQPQP